MEGDLLPDIPDDSGVTVVQSENPVSVSESSVSVDFVESDTPVLVKKEETEKEINLYVTVTPPSVDVKADAPIVTVESPVVNVETPVSPAVSADPLPDDGQTEDETLEFIPFSLLSLDSDFDESGESSGDTVRSVLLSLFGPYSPRTQTVTQRLTDGSEITYDEYVPGLAGLDVPWLASVFIFALILFCLFRMLGGVLKRG